MSEFKDVGPLMIMDDVTKVLTQSAWIPYTDHIQTATRFWTVDEARALRDWLNKALGSQEGRDE